MKKLHLSCFIALAAGGFLFAGDASAQYAPVGVQNNVPAATVTGGGWSVCHSSTFAEVGTPLATILANCSQANIMYACRLVGNPNFQVLAQAPRAAVFTDTGDNLTVTTSSNGTEWYFNANRSFGFAPGGQAVNKNTCDTLNIGNNDRICVHASVGNTSPGYRCGSNITFDATYERVILQSTLLNLGIALGSPATNTPALVAEELIIPPSRTLTNPGALNVSTEVRYAFSTGEVRYARLHCPGVGFAPGTSVSFTGNASNTIGAVNTSADGAINFSITAGATPVVPSDRLVINGNRILDGKAAVDCNYGLYDFPSQAQVGGTTGRVATSSGAYLRFGSSYALRVDSQGNPIANVESANPAYSHFALPSTTSNVARGQIGGFSYGTVAQIAATAQPITLDGAAVELSDLFGASTALKFAGDFSAATNVFLSTAANCSVLSQSANAGFNATEAVFTIGNAAAMNRFLCFATGNTAIPVSDYKVSLAAVSATPATYAVKDLGPLALGQITRNGTELQAPLAQVPDGYVSRLVLTNTGPQPRTYTAQVLREAGNAGTLGSAVTGTVPANGTVVVNMADILGTFTSGSPRGTVVVNVAGPNTQIQGLYQIVFPSTGALSNHVLVRPGSN